jgi:hypothetical protein
MTNSKKIKFDILLIRFKIKWFEMLAKVFNSTGMCIRD